MIVFNSYYFFATSHKKQKAENHLPSTDGFMAAAHPNHRGLPALYKKLRFFYRFSKISIICIVLFFSSCQPTQKSKLSDKVSPQERVWLTQFFTDIMLFEPGIYTLWGAHKPMTLIPAANYSEEEMKVIYESLSEEEKKKEGFSVNVIEGYEFSEAWGKWEQISHRFPMKRFMLFKQENEDPHLFFVVFVDIIKTAAVIQDNYEAFQKAIGFDFYAMELVLQMNQKDSVLWKNMNPYLEGLLFGYGKTNSQLFHWKYLDHPNSCDELCRNIKTSSSNEQLKGLITFTIDNFQIPSFACFNKIDPIVNIYKEERMMIKEIYKGRDFLDLTLEKLTE